jgi:hypothetical protein
MNRVLTEHRNDFDEVYHIFETAEFLRGGHHVRIEIYQAIHSKNTRFDVVAYEMKNDTWVRWSEMPWIDEPDSEAAMEKAVGFLREHMGPRDAPVVTDPAVEEASVEP